MKGEDKPRSGLKSAVFFGSNFAAGMGLFSFAGFKLDEHFGTEWKWTLAGVFFGLFYGAYEMWKILRNPDELDPDQ